MGLEEETHAHYIDVARQVNAKLCCFLVRQLGRQMGFKCYLSWAVLGLHCCSGILWLWCRGCCVVAVAQLFIVGGLVLRPGL